MATWKKVAVSGSDISQFNNDAGYITSITAQNAFATASYDGTLLLADDANGNLTFASSSDQGLTISANAGTDTLTFGLSAIPNTSLANSTISGISLGNNLNDLTVDNATLQLDSGTTYNGGTAKTISVKDGGIDTAAIATSLGTIGVNSFTGSFSGSFVGTTDLPDLTDGNGIADFTYDGSTTATISVESDTTTGGNVVGVSVTANGVGINVDNIDGTGLSASGGGLLDVDYGSTSGTAVQGDTTITLTQTAGEIDITGTAAQALGGGPSYTIGLADTISGNRTFSGDTITINNDLIVQGTASFQNTTNLEVADRFVLFASGSVGTGDGGIVVQQATQDVGELFGYDSGTTRWGVTSSFTANNSAYTPDAFMSAVTTLASTNPNTSGPAARYDAVGNIYVSSGDESIWIYS
jgi:trimeric autotransporter adhesin